MAKSNPVNQLTAFEDLWRTITQPSLWVYLAKFDIRGRYRRTVLGPIWTSLNALLFILIIAAVYSKFWGQSVAEFLPYVAAGYFVWIFISTTILESCSVYFMSSAFLQAAPISPIVFNMRVVLRNLIVLCHSFVVYVFIALYAGISFRYFLWIIPAVLLLAVIHVFVSIFLSILCSRYRDFEQVVTSIILAAFFVTPILYKIENLGGNAPIFLKLNPFTYMIDMVREPMMGRPPDWEAFIICASIACVGFVVAITAYIFTRKRLYLWI